MRLNVRNRLQLLEYELRTEDEEQHIVETMKAKPMRAMVLADVREFINDICLDEQIASPTEYEILQADASERALSMYFRWVNISPDHVRALWILDFIDPGTQRLWRWETNRKHDVFKMVELMGKKFRCKIVLEADAMFNIQRV